MTFEEWLASTDYTVWDKEYYETEDEKVYFFEPLEKEISVEDMQKIVDANETLVRELKLCGDTTEASQK
jgi:hypothetical protein